MKYFSIITGCNLKEHSIKGLQGADGALFWLVTVAARTVTILGINVSNNNLHTTYNYFYLIFLDNFINRIL